MDDAYSEFSGLMDTVRSRFKKPLDIGNRTTLPLEFLRQNLPRYKITRVVRKFLLISESVSYAET